MKMTREHTNNNYMSLSTKVKYVGMDKTKIVLQINCFYFCDLSLLFSIFTIR